jgi:hypothetical protein
LLRLTLGRVLTWCLVLLQKLEFYHDTKSCGRMGKIRNRSNAIALDHSQGAWDRLLPGDLAEKFDMAKSTVKTCGRSSGISQSSI